MADSILYPFNPSIVFVFSTPPTTGLHLEVLPMPTKAELEREVRKLRCKVAEFECREQEQENPEIHPSLHSLMS